MQLQIDKQSIEFKSTCSIWSMYVILLVVWSVLVVGNMWLLKDPREYNSFSFIRVSDMCVHENERKSKALVWYSLELVCCSTHIFYTIWTLTLGESNVGSDNSTLVFRTRYVCRVSEWVRGEMMRFEIPF